VHNETVRSIVFAYIILYVTDTSCRAKARAILMLSLTYAVLIHRAYTALRPLNSAVANDDIINDGSFTRD